MAKCVNATEFMLFNAKRTKRKFCRDKYITDEIIQKMLWLESTSHEVEIEIVRASSASVYVLNKYDECIAHETCKNEYSDIRKSLEKVINDIASQVDKMEKQISESRREWYDTDRFELMTEILLTLSRVWWRHPDFKLDELISSCSWRSDDIFASDEELLKALKEF